MPRDEVRQLTAELEVKNRELASKNRLADLGQMASHVAHEVRNNLVPVTLYLSMLRRHFGETGKSPFAGRARRVLAQWGLSVCRWTCWKRSPASGRWT